MLLHTPFQSSHPASWRTPAGSLKSGYWGTIKTWWTSHWYCSHRYRILVSQEQKPYMRSPYLITIPGGIFMPALVQKCALFLKDGKMNVLRDDKMNIWRYIKLCIMYTNLYQVLLVSCVRALLFSMHILHLLNSFQFVLIYNTERVKS